MNDEREGREYEWKHCHRGRVIGVFLGRKEHLLLVRLTERLPTILGYPACEVGEVASFFYDTMRVVREIPKA